MPPRLASEAATPLREALEHSGLSQRTLARMLGCDRRQVGAWVLGEHVPAPERREQIAKAVGSTVGELWPDADRGVRAA